MSRKHLELTAKIWSLALIAHTEGGEDGLEEKVRRLASKRAATKLRNMGIQLGDVLDEYDASDVAAAILSNTD